MIGILLSTIVVIGAINLYLGISKSGTEISQRNRLTEEVLSIRALLTRDLRRAGYWGADPATDELWNNPFTLNETDLQLSQMSGEAASSCVLYTYDLDGNGLLGDSALLSPASERFGFRLNNSKLEMFSAGDFDCDDGVWQTLSSPDIVISTLQFTPAETCMDVDNSVAVSCPCSGTACQHIRRLSLNIVAQLARDPGVTEMLQESIHVRNDKFVLNSP